MSTLLEAPLSRHEEAWNIRLVGHSDLNGHGDCMHVNLKDGYAFVGHMGESRVGTSVVDVSDPRNPRVVTQLETPPGTYSHKVQILGDVLLVNYEQNRVFEPQATSWNGGLKVFDVSRPAEPREIAFLPMRGAGVHRTVYWEEPYAYVTGSDEGYLEQFLIIVDLSDPTNPHEVGRWWYPGQHTAAGEPLTWVPGRGPGQRRFTLHHAIARGNRAYAGYWDAGLMILDISDKSKPSLVSHLDFGSERSGATHSALPLPGRDILVVTDEQLQGDCTTPIRNVWVVDIADERNPKVISTLPIPEGDFCERRGRVGPHNVHEPKPGSLIDPNTVYLTYCSAGLRVYDVSDPVKPREIAYYVPESPEGVHYVHFHDIYVAADGLIYVTDKYTQGLYILERTG